MVSWFQLSEVNSLGPNPYRTSLLNEHAECDQGSSQQFLRSQSKAEIDKNNIQIFKHGKMWIPGIIPIRWILECVHDYKNMNKRQYSHKF